jgi:hypothetical protein
MRLSAGVVGYRFVLPTIEAKPGESLRYTIEGEHEQSAQGFTLAATYPSSELTIDRVHIEDTILEAIGTDFFEVRLSPTQGTLVIGVLVDSRPPFDGNLIPNIGFALELVHLEVTVSPAAGGVLPIVLQNGISTPPVDNLYSVDNQARYLTDLGAGAIVLGPEEVEELFLRADVNMDLNVDISDPIRLLRFAFDGDHPPLCLVAADANDDEDVDVSDPIYILSFLFTGGPRPGAPFGDVGTDPTPGQLRCDQPLSRP